MAVWPKSFYTFRANLLTAGMARNLQRPGTDEAEQEKALAHLCDQMGSTSHWRGAGIEHGMTYQAFQAKVPLQTYDHLKPAIERMMHGDRDVLWPGACVLFAATSGTTTGRGRILPATEAMLAHFRTAGLASLLHYTARMGHAGIFRGRQLLHAGPTSLAQLPEAKTEPAFVGDISGIAALSLPEWAERHLYEPGQKVAQLSDWPARLEATARRVMRQDITLVAGLPTWTLELAHAVREKAAGPKRSIVNLKALWPNLECYVHGGIPIAPFYEELRTAFGKDVMFHEVYAATEAFVAAQDGEEVAGLRVMTEAGVFFEFLPLADYDERRIEQLGPKAVPLAGVTTGIDYALLVTTPGGLARYVLGDVVRFVSTAPPRLLYVGRTELQLNAFGERIAERHLTAALVAVCERKHWTIVNFHVAPLLASNLTGKQHGRHEWWIELRPGTISTPTGVAMAQQLDVELLRLSEDYAARRKAGVVETPMVRLVMPGVFEHWLRFHDALGGLHKTPRCRGDRTIADQLAQVTHFASD